MGDLSSARCIAQAGPRRTRRRRRRSGQVGTCARALLPQSTRRGQLLGRHHGRPAPQPPASPRCLKPRPNRSSRQTTSVSPHANSPSRHQAQGDAGSTPTPCRHKSDHTPPLQRVALQRRVSAGRRHTRVANELPDRNLVAHTRARLRAHRLRSIKPEPRQTVSKPDGSGTLEGATDQLIERGVPVRMWRSRRRRRRSARPTGTSERAP